MEFKCGQVVQLIAYTIIVINTLRDPSEICRLAYQQFSKKAPFLVSLHLAACSFSLDQAQTWGSLFFPSQKQRACNKEKYKTCSLPRGTLWFTRTLIHLISLFSVNFWVAVFHSIGISCMLWTKLSRYKMRIYKMLLFVLNDSRKTLQLYVELIITQGWRSVFWLSLAIVYISKRNN